MTVTTVSAREFARDLAAAKRATSDGPVFITDRGKPTLALLKIEDYYRLQGGRPRSLLEVMESIPCAAGIEFEAERGASLPREADWG
ncbi:prevent-host-death protein [Lysobacteraceae bacterium NML95-0200]|nr:prevent-host-death protein [Xanthomonadaceae bacterium NML95-0200]